MNAILITGATGNVGRPLVTHLVNAGVEVRAVTRHPDAAEFPAGVESWCRLPGQPCPARRRCFSIPARWARNSPRWWSGATRKACKRLVALSAINADDDFSRQPSRFRGDRNKEVEQLAVDSGVEWVSLRPTVFASNFVGMWSAQIKAGDVVSGPYAAASTAPIVETDIAAVAAHALLTDELVSQKIPLTGPQAFTNTELVDVIGTALGRPLRYQEMPPELVRQRFIGLGFPAEFADAYIAFLAATVDKPALVTHEVDKILGRPAESFAQWVSDHRTLFTN